MPCGLACKGSRRGYYDIIGRPSFIWGKHFWLGWVPSAPSLRTPSAGYVLQWKARRTERFREDQEHQDVFTCYENWTTEVTSRDAGYLLVSCVA